MLAFITTIFILIIFEIWRVKWVIKMNGGREIKLKYKYENKQNPVKKYKMSKKELEEYLKELEKRHSNKHQLKY